MGCAVQLPRKEVASSLVTAMGVLWAVSECLWVTTEQSSQLFRSTAGFASLSALCLHRLQVMGGALLYLIPFLSNVHSKCAHPSTADIEFEYVLHHDCSAQTPCHVVFPALQCLGTRLLTSSSVAG